MGVVYDAVDVSLNRPVAVKTLVPGRGSPEAARRFLVEAGITARLPHPGVPPVHAVGTLADGRPFLAMKLIRGQTLAALLAERPQPSHDLARWLQVFEQVCQTVGFAHSQGILHRDLKPANVMVGAFGEVQVMDWGLAKELGEEVVPLVEVGVAESNSDAELTNATVAGTVMGTPAYMPPEQVRGEVRSLTPRCDVFSLGAILCQILTGSPPYTGRGLLARAAAGDLAEMVARLAGSNVDSELSGIAIRSLSADPSERPADAGTVAGLLAAYRTAVEDRLRQAETERAAALATAAEQRKRRRVQLALATVVVVFVAGSGIGAWAYQKQTDDNRREEQVRENERERERDGARLRTDAVVAQVRDLQNRYLWSEAERLLADAEQSLGSDAEPELRSKLADVRADLNLLKRLDDIRFSRWQYLEKDSGKFDPAPANAAYAQAFKEAGFDIMNGDLKPVVDRLKASPIKAQLVSALDDWMVNEMSSLRVYLWSIAAAVGEEPWRARIATHWGSPERLRKLIADTPPEQRTAELILYVGIQLEAGHAADGCDILRAGCRQFPTDFWLHYHLATVLSHRSKPANVTPTRAPVTEVNLAEAVGSFRSALALRPNAALVWLNLSRALLLIGAKDEALETVRRGIELKPEFAHGYIYLYMILEARGENLAALAAVRESVRLDPKFWRGHAILANSLHSSGDLVGAEAEFRASILLKPNMWLFRVGLGFVLIAKGDWPGAVIEFRKATEVAPKEFTTWDNLGMALKRTNDRPGAINAYRKAASLTKTDPSAAVQLAEWKLEGYTNAEIGAKAGKSLATIERKLALIRSVWQSPPFARGGS